MLLKLLKIDTHCAVQFRNTWIDMRIQNNQFYRQCVETLQREPKLKFIGK